MYGLLAGNACAWWEMRLLPPNWKSWICHCLIETLTGRQEEESADVCVQAAIKPVAAWSRLYKQREEISVLTFKLQNVLFHSVSLFEIS